MNPLLTVLPILMRAGGRDRLNHAMGVMRAAWGEVNAVYFTFICCKEPYIDD